MYENPTPAGESKNRMFAAAVAHSSTNIISYPTTDNAGAARKGVPLFHRNLLRKSVAPSGRMRNAPSSSDAPYATDEHPGPPFSHSTSAAGWDSGALPGANRRVLGQRARRR